jgi:hypothetical protein
MDDFCIRRGAICAYGMGDLCIRMQKSCEGFRTYGPGIAVIPIPGNRSAPLGVLRPKPPWGRAWYRSAPAAADGAQKSTAEFFFSTVQSQTSRPARASQKWKTIVQKSVQSTPRRAVSPVTMRLRLQKEARQKSPPQRKQGVQATTKGETSALSKK